MVFDSMAITHFRRKDAGDELLQEERQSVVIKFKRVNWHMHGKKRAPHRDTKPRLSRDASHAEELNALPAVDLSVPNKYPQHTWSSTCNA